MIEVLPPRLIFYCFFINKFFINLYNREGYGVRDLDTEFVECLKNEMLVKPEASQFRSPFFLNIYESPGEKTEEEKIAISAIQKEVFILNFFVKKN